MSKISINSSKVDLSKVVPSPEVSNLGADVSKDAEAYLDKLIAKEAKNLDKKLTAQKKSRKTAQSTPQRSDDPQPSENVERKKVDLERQRTIARILKYQDSEHFGDIVQTELQISYTYDALTKKNNQQLESILNRIRVNIDRNAIDTFYDNMVGGGSLFTEKMLTDLGYDITGFSNNLLYNKQFVICFERYKIESDLPTIPLGIQIAQIIISTAIITHMNNKKGDTKRQNDSEEDDEEDKK